MATERTRLQTRIEGNDSILLAELVPPRRADTGWIREYVGSYANTFHAIGVPDNRDGARMSAVAAASLVASEGMEPILHIVTRDRNRIALISDCLGAQALGIRNILCTSGLHQTLGPAGAAKAVFDLDSVQLLRAYSKLENEGSVVGEEGFEGTERLLLAATATPEADPMPLQLTRVEKKIEAGASLLITQPVFDVARFEAWWDAAKERDIPGRAVVVAGIEVLSNAVQATALAESRPDPMIPADVLQRMTAKENEDAQREEGLAIAVETLKRLSALDGLRGFQMRGPSDLVMSLVERAELKVN